MLAIRGVVREEELAFHVDFEWQYLLPVSKLYVLRSGCFLVPCTSLSPDGIIFSDYHRL